MLKQATLSIGFEIPGFPRLQPTFLKKMSVGGIDNVKVSGLLCPRQL